MTIKTESRTYFRELGAIISEHRKEIGMTQAELASALGVSQQTVFAYELGDRRVSLLIVAKLAQIFQMSVEELIGLRRAPRPIRCRLSPAGIRHADRFQQLRRTEQRFVKKIMDVLLESNSPRRSVASN
jgi:transcriptional regulator with XRE-family HTH domain